MKDAGTNTISATRVRISLPRILFALRREEQEKSGRKAEEFAMRRLRLVSHRRVTYLHVSRVGRWRNYFSRFYEGKFRNCSSADVQTFSHSGRGGGGDATSTSTAWSAAFQRGNDDFLAEQYPLLRLLNIYYAALTHGIESYAAN